MATVALDINEYEALLTWARAGALQVDQDLDFLQLRKRIDMENSITRYTLVIRFERLPQMPAPGITESPKGETVVLELLRPPTRQDAMAALEGQNFHASLVWVTADPNGEVGWYDLESYPWA